MNFFIDYQVKSNSRVVADQYPFSAFFLSVKKEALEEKKAKPISREDLLEKISKDKSAVIIFKENFLEILTQDDCVWLEMGGGADNFCLAAIRKGVKIKRIPTYKIKQMTEAFNEKCFVIATTAKNNPDWFYEIGQREANLLKLLVLHRARLMIMERMRKPMHLRMQNVLQDVELLLPDDLVGAEAKRDYAINFALSKFIKRQEQIDKLLSDIESRADEKSLESIAKIRKLFASTEKGMKENPIFYEAKEAEEFIYKEIEKLLPSFEIYGQFMEPIRGIGPRIAGGLIAEIGDIRRFKSPAALCQYCGYGFWQNGEEWAVESLANAKHSDAGCANYNQYLKQTLWLLGDQFVKQRDPKYRDLYDNYKLRIKEKHPAPIELKLKSGKSRYEWSDKHIHLTAMRKTITRFLWNLWKQWMRLTEPAIYSQWNKNCR